MSRILFTLLVISLASTGYAADFSIENSNYADINRAIKTLKISAVPAPDMVIKPPVNSQCVGIGSAQAFNVFIKEDLLQAGSDTQGRIAVGGNARFISYTVGDQLKKTELSASPYSLIVHGDLKYESKQPVPMQFVIEGKAAYGGILSSANAVFNYGIKHMDTDSIVKISAAFEELKNISGNYRSHHL